MAARLPHRLRRFRQGFTLVEALAVLAVLSLSFALLLPAVQRVREAARRAQCRSNLRQIGLALHGYHNAHGCLPYALMLDSLPGGERHTRSTFLPPFLDQQPLYAQVNPNGEHGFLTDHYERFGGPIPAGTVALSVYRCPSSLLPSHAQHFGPHVLPGPLRGYATIDHRGSFREW